MSLRNTVRSLPAMFRVSFAESLAYRAEMLVWVLSTSMPLIMLAFWTAVARDSPVVTDSGRAFDGAALTAYFLTTFIVRQLNASWVAWEMNFEVRDGSLSKRLLRPVHPIASYAVENLAALPMRLAVAIPVATVLLLTVGGARLPSSPALWGVWALSMLGGWLISFLTNTAVGCLSLFLQSSIKVMDVWLALFFVFGGYLFPIELFPPALRTLAGWLPFRYQVGFPVEVMNSLHPLEEALALLGRQWLFVAILFGLVVLLWRQGIKRFGAYGG